MPNQILVTKPFLPNTQDFYSMLLGLWQSRVLSNSGELHQLLEKQLLRKLDVTILYWFIMLIAL